MQGLSLLPAIAGAAPSRAAMLVEEDTQRREFGFPEPPRLRTVITPRERLSMYAGAPWASSTISSTTRTKNTTVGKTARAAPTCWS
jgi:arylsulfatase